MLALYFFYQFTVAFMPPATTPVFETQTIDDNISIGYGLALTDVDGDGKPDILLADKKQFVWYRNGDWKRFVMIENLTERDNVCIAARDLDGDGKAEIAVGAQWNPGETSDAAKSGSVHYLVRPADATQMWTAIALHHEPTIHRMQWVKTGDGFYLVVVPLHGRGNANGEGRGVKIIGYKFPTNPKGEWSTVVLDSTMHLTHNLTLLAKQQNGAQEVYIGGKEGVRKIVDIGSRPHTVAVPGMDRALGELRTGKVNGQPIFATIEPMHGTTLAVYHIGKNTTRQVLDEQLKEGHALAVADVMRMGNDQVIAGWRVPNNENKTGIKIYVPGANNTWTSHWIDENGMATEDLQVLDMNGDGKPDIVAAGRATKNLKIYWNRN